MHIDTSMKERKRKPLSDAHKAKISKVHKGKFVSPETRAKLSLASKGFTRRSGFTVSEETRAKMSAAHKGKKFSDETRRRMSVSRRRYAEKMRAMQSNTN